MLPSKTVEGNKSHLQSEGIGTVNFADPMSRDSQVRLAILIRPYVSRERNLS